MRPIHTHTPGPRPPSTARGGWTNGRVSGRGGMRGDLCVQVSPGGFYYFYYYYIFPRRFRLDTHIQYIYISIQAHSVFVCILITIQKLCEYLSSRFVASSKCTCCVENYTSVRRRLVVFPRLSENSSYQTTTTTAYTRRVPSEPPWPNSLGFIVEV